MIIIFSYFMANRALHIDLDNDTLSRNLPDEVVGNQPILPSLPSEHTLWTRFSEGEEAAFAQLYQGTFDLLYNYGMKLCRNRDLVKDSIHDLYVDLWNHPKPNQVKAIKPYLYKALRNIVLKAQDKQFASRKLEGNYDFTFEDSAETHHIAQETQQLSIAKLRQALTHLTQRQREVIFLKYFYQLSYEEVATILEISTKATYKLVSRAIAIIKNNITLLLLLLSIFIN